MTERDCETVVETVGIFVMARLVRAIHLVQWMPRSSRGMTHDFLPSAPGRPSSGLGRDRSYGHDAYRSIQLSPTLRRCLTMPGFSDCSMKQPFSAAATRRRLSASERLPPRSMSMVKATG